MNHQKYNVIKQAINWVHDKTSERQFLIISSILVGISTGIAAVILKLFVSYIRKYLVEDYLLKLNFKIIFFLLPLIGIGITVLIVKYILKNQLQKGNTSILNAIAKKSSFLPFTQMYSHVITSAFTVGFGGSAGLESPIVSTGSAIGSNFARTYKLSYKDRTMLLAAGVAGGIAGAFNAPIAGVLFALEVILVDISISAFIPLLIASASGALIANILLQEENLLFFKLKQPFDYYNVPFYILLAIVSGFMALYYVNAFEKIENSISSIKSTFTKWIVGGVVMAILLVFFPTLFGEGYESIKLLSEYRVNEVTDNSVLSYLTDNKWLMLLFIFATLLLKPFAVAITIGSGGNGGNFAPSLFFGAYLGFIFANFLNLIGFTEIPISNFTIVAMAGILSGVFHAPLTAIFLIAEITGGYELIIPLMIVSSLSYVIVKHFHPQSLDIKRLKLQGTIITDDKDTSTLSKINVKDLIETDFSSIHFKASLRNIVETIKHCKRNTFPVVNKYNKLLGIIYLDDIREEMFNAELYDKIIAKELMRKTDSVIDINEDIFSIMKKFKQSGQWNLPVTDNNHYIGFLSKSTILDRYRNQLLASV